MVSTTLNALAEQPISAHMLCRRFVAGGLRTLLVQCNPWGFQGHSLPTPMWENSNREYCPSFQGIGHPSQLFRHLFVAFIRRRQFHGNHDCVERVFGV